eukprot:767895-Hanusia_phi.AAC.4
MLDSRTANGSRAEERQKDSMVWRGRMEEKVEWRRDEHWRGGARLTLSEPFLTEHVRRSRRISRISGLSAEQRSKREEGGRKQIT